MRSFFCALLVSAVIGCSSSTEPNKAGDPSLLITNNLPFDYVYVTWQDGNAIIGRDSVAPMTALQCVRFLAQPDSAKWIITVTEHSGGSLTWASVGGNWFNPADRPAWNVIVTSQFPPNGTPLIAAWDSAAAVNGPVYGETRAIPKPC